MVLTSFTIENMLFFLLIIHMNYKISIRPERKRDRYRKTEREWDRQRIKKERKIEKLKARERNIVNVGITKLNHSYKDRHTDRQILCISSMNKRFNPSNKLVFFLNNWNKQTTTTCTCTTGINSFFVRTFHVHIITKTFLKS